MRALQDNTRIYYVPREDEDLKTKVVQALQAGPGASFTLNGNAADAYNGQVIALVLPPARFCGFAQLDFQAGGSNDSLASGTACILKVSCATTGRQTNLQESGTEGVMRAGF